MAMATWNDVGQNSLLNFITGEPLLAVRALFFDPRGEPGVAIRTAIALDFGEKSLVIEALSDTDTINVFLGSLDQCRHDSTAEDYRDEDVSGSEPFCIFIGKPIRNSWFLVNDAGLRDGFMVAFEPGAGLCFVAMVSNVSVQLIKGDQFS